LQIAGRIKGLKGFMPSFKLTIAYDGTSFVGWQRQASGESIQGLLEDALAVLDGREVAVAGAGRTDAGVHALSQVASVTLERDIDAATVVRAVNARLPPAIRVIDAREVPAAFHARFDARSKTYRYRIWNADVMDPFERAYAWHVPAPVLDERAMDQAARTLEGRHDFAAFQTVGTETGDTERSVSRSRVERAGSLITYEISGDGFLRHMVRAVVGTLVDVGRRHLTPSSMGEVLASKDRARAGRTAPAEGLFLVRVDYDYN
jgi:tRNA pseudouridine38-40 synthase